MADAMAQHQEVLAAVKGVSAESGRALGSFRVQPPDTQISNALRELSPEALQEARELLRKIDPNNPRQLNNWLEKVKPSTTADQLFEAYRNWLLSGPGTLIKRGASEMTMIALEATRKSVAAGLSKLKGGEDQRFLSEGYWFSKGVVDAMRHIPKVLTGEFDLTDSPDFEKTNTQAIKGPLGDIIRIPSTLLSKQANVAYMLNYFGELNSQAARQALRENLSGPELAARQEYLVEDPTEAMSKAAHETAIRGTFQRDLGKFGKSLQGVVRNDPTGLLRFLVPFTKTPSNLLKEGEYYSPYGLLKGTLTGDVDMQSRGVIGSALAAGIAYLALNGRITGGGPVDFKKKQTLESTGWQSYSIKIGDKYYSYRKLEPVGLSMALVSDAVHSMKAGDSEVVSQSKADTAINHIARNLKDVSFLPTFANVMEAIENPGSRAEKFISKEAGSLVPALVKDIAQASDRTVRRPTGPVQEIESRVPGLTSQVPALTDVVGRPVQRPASALRGANPFPISKQNNDPVIQELARLGIATTQPPASVKMKGKSFQLTGTERQQLAQQEGDLLRGKVAKWIATKAWASLDDDQRRKKIAELRRDITATRPRRLTKLRNRALGNEINARRDSSPGTSSE